MKPRSYGGHQILKQSWNAKTQMMLFLSTQDEQIIAKHFAECFSCCSASICKHLPSAKLCLGMSTDEHRYFLIGLFFIFKYGPSPAYFCLFSFFSNNLQNKTVDFSGIWSRIVGTEGEPADHLTTTTGLFLILVSIFIIFTNWMVISIILLHI